MGFITFWSPGKPCLVKYFKWLLRVIQEAKAGKGHIVLLDQTTNALRSPKGRVPSLRVLGRTLMGIVIALHPS